MNYLLIGLSMLWMWLAWEIINARDEDEDTY